MLVCGMANDHRARRYHLAWHPVLRLRTCNISSPLCNSTSEPKTLTESQTERAAVHLASLGPRMCEAMNATNEAMRDIADDINGSHLIR